MRTLFISAFYCIIAVVKTTVVPLLCENLSGMKNRAIGPIFSYVIYEYR